MERCCSKLPPLRPLSEGVARKLSSEYWAKAAPTRGALARPCVSFGSFQRQSSRETAPTRPSTPAGAASAAASQSSADEALVASEGRPCSNGRDVASTSVDASFSGSRGGRCCSARSSVEGLSAAVSVGTLQNIEALDFAEAYAEEGPGRRRLFCDAPQVACASVECKVEKDVPPSIALERCIDTDAEDDDARVLPASVFTDRIAEIDGVLQQLLREAQLLRRENLQLTAAKDSPRLLRRGVPGTRRCSEGRSVSKDLQELHTSLEDDERSRWPRESAGASSVSSSDEANFRPKRKGADELFSSLRLHAAPGISLQSLRWSVCGVSAESPAIDALHQRLAQRDAEIAALRSQLRAQATEDEEARAKHAFSECV